MAGTPEGGRLAAAKNKSRNPNHFKELGSKGGKISRGGGFAAMSHEQVQAVGRKGGLSTNLSPEGRARRSAAMKAYWAHIKELQARETA